MSCLDELMLEKVLLGAAPEASAHLEQCAECGARLSQMRVEDAQFRQYVFPATVDAVVKSTVRPAARLWRWLVPAGGLGVAALATMLLMVSPRGPAADYVGDKGQTLGLAIYTLDPSGAAVQLSEGAQVSANAVLRFQVSPKKACYLWILSVDARGQVSRLYPERGDPPLISGRLALPGGATLDGQPGPERFFGVCSSSALPFSAVQSAVKIEPSAEAVRHLRELALAQTVQGTLLIEKQP
jgi:hypothetical protein